MPGPWKLLVVANAPASVALVTDALRAAGYPAIAEPILTEAALLNALAGRSDAILVVERDSPLGTRQVLDLLHARNLDLPVLILTAAEREAEACALLAAGAADCLALDHLARLGPALEAAIALRQLRAEHRQLQAAAAVDLERCRLALQSANEGVWDWDISADQIYYSPRWQTMLGYEPGEIGSDTAAWERLLHPEDRARAVAAIEALLAGESAQYECEYRLRTKAGDWLWVLDRGMVVARDAQGRPLRAVGTHSDISARKQAEETLAHLNCVLEALRQVNRLCTDATDRAQLLQAVCDALAERAYFHAWIVLIDRDRRPTVFATSGTPQANQRFQEFVQRGELSSCARAALDHAQILMSRNPAQDCADCPLTAEYGSCGVMTQRLNYGEAIFGVLTVSLPVHLIGDERESGLFSELVSDVSNALHRMALEAERACTEAARQAEHARAQTYLDVAGVMLVVLDRQGRVQLINKHGCAILGYDEAEILGQDWFAHFLPERDRDAVRAVFDQIIAGQIESAAYFDNYVLTRSGEERLIGWHNTTLRDAAGQIMGTLSSGEDITDRQRAQDAEREQREVAEALGEVAALLNSTLDFDAVIERIITSLGRVLPYDAANLMVIEGDRVRVLRHLGYAERGLTAWIENINWPLSDVPNLQHQFQTGQPLAISSVQEHPLWRPIPQADWIGSFVSAPIIQEGRVVGFLNLDKAEPGFYTDQHAGRLLAFANQAAVAMRNARLYDMVQRHAQELEQRVAERTAALRESEARYRAIVEDQTELICRFVADATLTYANGAFCRAFGLHPATVTGKDLMPLVYPDDRALIAQGIRQLSPDQPWSVLESRAILATGEVRWFQWTCRVILDEQGQFLEYQGVGRDITERRQADDVLRKSLAREMQIGELKSRFVSLVSHEFRNPLAVILMNSDILRRYSDRLSPEQRTRYLDGIRLHVNEMTEMLDDLLLVSQSEAGKLVLKPETMDLVAFSRRIVDEVWTTSGADRQLDLELPAAECRVLSDPKLFRLIVANLVSNAAKYSQPGGVVSVRLSCDAERIQLVVVDRGIGIPEHDRPRLFETFFRASNVGDRAGTGLGLALVKQCVEQLGGTIACESQEGVGTTFTVLLPRQLRTPITPILPLSSSER